MILDVRWLLFFFWWIILSTDFLRLAKKIKKIYRLEVWSFCKMHHPIPFFFALRLSVRQFQMPLEGSSFMKTLATFGTIYASDPVLQIWLDSPSIFLVINSSRPWWITFADFSKSGQFFTRFISKTKSVTPICFAFLTQVTHYLRAVKILM